MLTSKPAVRVIPHKPFKPPRIRIDLKEVFDKLKDLVPGQDIEVKCRSEREAATAYVSVRRKLHQAFPEMGAEKDGLTIRIGKKDEQP